MRALSKASLVLGAVTTLVGYAIIIVNIVSLRKSRKVRRIVD